MLLSVTFIRKKWKGWGVLHLAGDAYNEREEKK
jgi:hypothetical protein